MKPPSHTRCDDAGSARFTTAGRQNIANIQQFTASANASGQFVIAFTSVTNNALMSDIETDQQARWTQGGNDHGSRKWFNIARIARRWRCFSNG
ncbi:MAG TPA: hypothetical protein VGH38_19985 [Bryobacteraceae bacterium]|jgi:hypothetical protein